MEDRGRSFFGVQYYFFSVGRGLPELPIGSGAGGHAIFLHSRIVIYVVCTTQAFFFATYLAHVHWHPHRIGGSFPNQTRQELPRPGGGSRPLVMKPALTT